MDIFSFSKDDYRDYVASFLDSQESKERRTDLAKFLGCQNSFVSQVLTGRAHFSLEHAVRISNFLGHSVDERTFFMLLVQRDRSGSTELTKFYEEQITEILSRRQSIQERIGVRTTISEQDLAVYYSAWWHAAIHMVVGLPEIKSAHHVAQRLNLDLHVVRTSLDFLHSRKLVIKKNGELRIGKNRIHLGAQSMLIARHHSNWREIVLSSLERVRKDDLHYSAMLAISIDDAKKIRSHLLDLIENIEPIVRHSPDEIPVALLVDFFEV